MAAPAFVIQLGVYTFRDATFGPRLLLEIHHSDRVETETNTYRREYREKPGTDTLISTLLGSVSIEIMAATISVPSS